MSLLSGLENETKMSRDSIPKIKKKDRILLRETDWFNYLERSERLRRSDWSTNFLEQSERLTRRSSSTNDVEWSEQLWREDWFITFLARREKLSFLFSSRKEMNPSLLMSFSLRLTKFLDRFLPSEPLASLEVIEPIRLPQQYSIFFFNFRYTVSTHFCFIIKARKQWH